MNSKRVFTLLALLGLASISNAVSYHPVRQEIVDEIKQKTNKW